MELPGWKIRRFERLDTIKNSFNEFKEFLSPEGKVYFIKILLDLEDKKLDFDDEFEQLAQKWKSSLNNFKMYQNNEKTKELKPKASKPKTAKKTKQPIKSKA
jgi:hypothetical protein